MVMVEAAQVTALDVGTVQGGVPDGYKLTEIGLIPNDWQFKLLGEVISLQRGHDLTARQRRQGDVPVMGSAGQNGFHDTALVEGSGVVLGRSGASYGQAHYCQNSFWPHNTALYVTDFRGSDPLFVFYLLQSIDFSRHNSGGAQQSLNRNFIYPIPVAVPNPNEQKVIAQAISDADALISSLGQLIEKKRLIKQGTMQDLLSGRKRLPGFEQEWETKRVGDLLTVKHGKSQSAVAEQNGRYPILATGGQIGRAREFLYDKPSVLIGRKGTIDRPQFMDRPFWTVDTLFYSVVKEPNSAKFIYFAFILIDWMRHNEASGVPSLNAKTIEQIELRVPPEDEQRAIAAAITDMDEEIAALEVRLNKTRQIKQGMMQELLTGRVRLV